MDDTFLLWPKENMNFKKVENKENTVLIKWSHNNFEDYKKLAYEFHECGYLIFDDAINSDDNNIKLDMWFLAGLFLVRQSIELGLKSLICRCCTKNSEIQNIFINCCHDLSMLFQNYKSYEKKDYLTSKEKAWLENYLKSLEKIDSKSDVFRFPFEDDFLAKYRNKFLDSVAVANNLLQAFSLVKKCIQYGVVVDEEDNFIDSFIPEFFIFSSSGIGNCYLWQSINDNGFYAKINGYSGAIDFLYNNKDLTNEKKIYPIIFMFRNTLELSLKRIFYSKVSDGVSLKAFNSKRKSHLIKKDLWKNVKPVVLNYAQARENDIAVVEIVDDLINEINSIDKNGDMFRYPTSYSLEYRFDNEKIDLKNVYEYYKSIINFLDGCAGMLDEIADYEAEILFNMTF